MPQKPLKPQKNIKKKPAANRHGKTPGMKKGKFDLPPKKQVLREQYLHDKEMTKYINANNEAKIAGVAEGKGGKLGVVKAPPPVLATADAKGRAKVAKQLAGD